MRPSLFRSGFAPRLGGAAVYGLLAFGAVALLGPTRAGRETPASVAGAALPTPATTRPATLCLESLGPVATWDVQLDGAPIAPRRSDASTWIAEVALRPGSSLVIDATPAGERPAGRNALRIRIAGTPASRDQTFWCDHAWSVTTGLGQLAPAAAPIDPADLP